MPSNDDERPYKVVLSPEVQAAADKDPDLAAALKQMENLLAEKGIRALLARSQRMEPAPLDDRCPKCGEPLTRDQSFTDEQHCLNPACPDEGLVVYLDEDTHADLQARAEGFDAGENA